MIIFSFKKTSFGPQPLMPGKLKFSNPDQNNVVGADKPCPVPALASPASTKKKSYFESQPTNSTYTKCVASPMGRLNFSLQQNGEANTNRQSQNRVKCPIAAKNGQDQVSVVGDMVHIGDDACASRPVPGCRDSFTSGGRC